MTSSTLLFRSLAYHWRSQLAMLLCIATGTAVLTGALLVGDSMRGSLVDLTMDRLGRVDYSLSSARFFGEDLAKRLRAGISPSDLSGATGEQSSNDPNHFELAAQYSLRSTQYSVLSTYHSALGSHSAALATHLWSSTIPELPRTPQIEPAILLRGSVARVDAFGKETARAGGAQICGVTREFWSLNRSGVSPFWVQGWSDATEPAVVLNESLAHELGAEVGDVVLLKVEKPSDIPREAALGRKDDLLLTLRLLVSQIVSARDMGSFKLDANQRTPRNAFLPLDRLAEAIRQPGRANTLLVSEHGSIVSRNRRPSAEQTTKSTAALQQILRDQLRLEDLGLRLRADASQDTLSLESSRMVLEPAVATAAEEAARRLELVAWPSLTYLANSIGRQPGEDRPPADHEIPYSVVAALPIEAASPMGSLRLTTGEPVAGLADDEILINTWAAEDLGARPGDEVSLTYFLAEPSKPFETGQSTFRLRGVVEIEGVAADPGLVPEYPGITDKQTYADWDPPFPMDLKRVRRKDEDYWKKYRATPKAFVSLVTGERLWGSRFGKWTSIRLAIGNEKAGEQGSRGAEEKREGSTVSPTPLLPHSTAEQLKGLRERFQGELLRRLRPEQLGLVFQPVKAQGLAASQGATDFSGLFIGFSFFLIVSAVILVSLVFRLGVERRAKELGLLMAVGFDRARLTRLLLYEGTVVAFVGSLVGLAGAVGYAWLMIAGLRTWWLPAVGTSLLGLHVTWPSISIGGLAGILLAALAIVVSLRGLTRLPPRLLLAGSVTEPMGKVLNSKRWPMVLSVTSALVALMLPLIDMASESRRASSVLFFSAGTLGLVSLLSGLFGLLGGSGKHNLRGRGLWALTRLGARNGARHRGRSVLTTGLVACAVFVIVTVAANRTESTAESLEKSSGSGGFSWMAESDVPILHDLNSPSGRGELGIPDDAANSFEKVHLFPFRLRPGEDASCLNLYQPTRPRVLGATTGFITRGGFRVQRSLARSSAETENPWRLLDKPLPDGSIPAIGDANTVEWILHLGLGKRLPVTAEDGSARELQIVALLDTSIFQSELVISEANFLKLFPSLAGYSYFLIEAGEAERGGRRAERLTDSQTSLPTLLEQHLSDYGFDVSSAAERLAEYHQVENTYLSTFQMLGGLGLVLGTLGVGAVLLRNVLERRGELALLLAVGFRPAALVWLVLAENGFLLVAGLVSGAVSALVAVAPHVLSRGAEFPWLSLVGTLALVLLAGTISAGAAVLATLRTPLLPALRSE